MTTPMMTGLRRAVLNSRGPDDRQLPGECRASAETLDALSLELYRETGFPGGIDLKSQSLPPRPEGAVKNVDGAWLVPDPSVPFGTFRFVLSEGAE